MVEDAREIALATGADFESDFRGAGLVGIMQPCVQMCPIFWLIKAFLLVCTHALSPEQLPWSSPAAPLLATLQF